MKKYIKILFLLFLVETGCNAPSPTNSTQNLSNKNVTKIDSEKWVKSYFDDFNAHNWEALAAKYIENAIFKDPSFGKETVQQTRAQTIAKYTELAQVFPNLRDSVLKIYPSGEKNVIVEFVSKGTSADGKTAFEMPICTIFTIENGLITEDFTYYDNFGE